MKLEKRDLVIRPRRLRRTDVLRRLVRETHLHTDDFIAPIFIIAGKNKKNSITSMPGVYQWSIDRVNQEIDELLAAGIGFGDGGKTIGDCYARLGNSIGYYRFSDFCIS